MNTKQINKPSENIGQLEFLRNTAIEMIAALEHDISISIYDGKKGHDPEAEAELEQWRSALKWLEHLREATKKIDEDLEKAAIQAAQIDMCDRQIMEDSHEHRMLYSRIFRRGFKACAKWQKEQMKPIRVIAEDAWELSDGRVFAGKLRIVDDGCGDAIIVPGFNEEFTLYKED